MFLLGILGLLQVWFLPGLALLSFSKKLRIFDIIILSVPLSITINTFIVYFLVGINLYSQPSLLFIIFFEISLLIFNFLKNQNLNQSILQFENFFKAKKEIVFKTDIFDFPILFFFIVISYFGFQTIGEVIHIGDALRSFNPWSISWYNSEPIHIGLYTPGLPILMSMAYKLIDNTSVEFFTRAIIIIYPIWVFLIYYKATLIIPKNKKFIKISLIISSITFIYIFRNYAMYVGLTEPILYLTAVSSAYILLLIFLFENKYTTFEYIIFGLIIISSPIIKQTGFYLTATLPLMYLIYYFNKKNTKEFFYNFFVILSVISIPYFWLLNKLLQIYIFETSKTNLAGIISLNEGSVYDKLFYVFGFLALPYLLLTFYSLINKKSSIIFFIVSLPYFLLFAIFFGYDNRHFVLILPFLSINITFGIYELSKKLKKINFKLPKYFSIFFIFVIFISILSIINIYRDEKRLVDTSELKKMLRGDSQVNTLLLHYIEKNNLNIVSIPDQLEFSHIPLIEKRFKVRTKCSEYKVDEKKFYLMIQDSYCKQELGDTWLSLYLNEGFKLLFQLNNHSLLIKDIND